MTNEEAYARIKHMIASPYHPCVKGYISCLTGRTSVVGPDDIMFTPAFDYSSESYDFDPLRITIDTKQGVILDFFF